MGTVHSKFDTHAIKKGVKGLHELINAINYLFRSHVTTGKHGPMNHFKFLGKNFFGATPVKINGTRFSENVVEDPVFLRICPFNRSC